MTKPSVVQSSNKHQRIEMILERSRSLANTAQDGNRIVLVHDPPQVTFSSSSSSSATSQNHKNHTDSEALYSFLLHMGCPVIFIVSDVTGRDEYHYAAERCLPSSIRDK